MPFADEVSKKVDNFNWTFFRCTLTYWSFTLTRYTACSFFTFSSNKKKWTNPSNRWHEAYVGTVFASKAERWSYSGRKIKIISWQDVLGKTAQRSEIVCSLHNVDKLAIREINH